VSRPSVAVDASLSPADDHLVHRGPGTLGMADTPHSQDLRFFERYWNVLHDETGDLVVAIGGSRYPNLGRAESYAVVNLRGDHRSVRAFGRLGDCDDRSDLTVGPLRPTIVTGLREWRHTLEHGGWGFSYDLTTTDTHRAVHGAVWGPRVETGERQVTVGFETFVAVHGWVRIGDTRMEWPAGCARGTRDRHWGVGRGVGGPALNDGVVRRGGWKGGIWIDLGDLAIWGKTVLYPHGDPRPGAGKVERVHRKLRFEPDTQILSEGLIGLTLSDGTTRHLHLERLGTQTAYLRCGFYGGTPDGPGAEFPGLQHGEYYGPPRVEWDRYDVTDPVARLALRGLDEHHCRVREIGGPRDGCTTTGILQPLEPDAYEACVAGKPGWELW
jgi:hypothetical protein